MKECWRLRRALDTAYGRPHTATLIAAAPPAAAVYSGARGRSTRWLPPAGLAEPRLALAGISLRGMYAVEAPVRGFALSGARNDEAGRSRERMVRPERFELPTFGFVVRRSIQLS